MCRKCVVNIVFLYGLVGSSEAWRGSSEDINDKDSLLHKEIDRFLPIFLSPMIKSVSE